MTSVAIVFFSGSGTTRRLAQAVAEGVKAQAVDCHMLEILGSDIVEGRWVNDQLAEIIDECDAVIFGSPTYMGSVSGQLKTFFDAMAPRWFNQRWNTKIGAAFTASSLVAGDKLNCLYDMTTFAMQMGMVWVGTGAGFSDGLNPHGFYLGVGAAASSPDQLEEIDLKTGAHLGGRVANIAKRMSEDALPTT